MKLHFVLIALIVISIIQNSETRGRRNTKKPFYRPPKGALARARQSRQQKKGVNTRGTFGSAVGSAADKVGSAAGAVAGFASKKVKQVVILIKCVIKCFVQNLLNLKICNRMFPCLYDCFIGQEYIPPDVQKEIDKNEGGTSIYPAAITLEGIYNSLKCVYNCATERPIRNWETFVFVLYCFADSCICYQFFGA